MRIGIISDTHDDIENVQRAIDLFGREEVKLIIHAGDFVFPGVIDEFKNLKNMQPRHLHYRSLGEQRWRKASSIEKIQ
jgi:predicted phosphodiesterase